VVHVGPPASRPVGQPAPEGNDSGRATPFDWRRAENISGAWPISRSSQFCVRQGAHRRGRQPSTLSAAVAHGSFGKSDGRHGRISIPPGAI